MKMGEAITFLMVTYIIDHPVHVKDWVYLTRQPWVAKVVLKTILARGTIEGHLIQCNIHSRKQSLMLRVPLVKTIKVAYNSGMFDNSHLLIMQYFFGTICVNFLNEWLIPKTKWLNLSGLALQIFKLFGI